MLFFSSCLHKIASLYGQPLYLGILLTEEENFREQNWAI